MNRELDLLYNALYLSLEQEYECYQEFLKSIKEEATLLKRCTAADLLELNARNERLLLSLGMASELRANAIKKITSHLHLDEPVTMGQLIAYAQNQTRQNLIHCQAKFADLIHRIKKANDHNKDLITFSLTHINNTLSYINSLFSVNPNYDYRGKIQAGNLQGRLISKAG